MQIFLIELLMLVQWSVEKWNCRSRGLTVPSHGSHAWVAIQVQTKFLRLFREVTIGDRIEGWPVCWIGGWDKGGVLFVVMVDKRLSANRSASEFQGFDLSVLEMYRNDPRFKYDCDKR